jgi:hypothetical protein
LCNPWLGADFMKPNVAPFTISLELYAVAGLNVPPPDAVVPPMYSVAPLTVAGMGEVENRLLDHFTGAGIFWSFKDSLYP